MIGINKPSVKKVKKNILPPFDDERWIVYSSVRDIVRNGYETSFYANSSWSGLTFSVPLEYAGKTLSLSTLVAKGAKSSTYLSWKVGSTWTHKILTGGGKIENQTIPSNASEIKVYVQSHEGGAGTCYFKDVQLEEGSVATKFEEQIVEGGKSLYELVPKNNLFRKSYYFANGLDDSVSGRYDITEGLANGAYYTLSGNFRIFSDDLSTNNRISIIAYYTDGTFTSVSTPVGEMPKDGVFRFQSISVKADSSKTLSKIGGWIFDYSAHGGFVHREAYDVQLEIGAIATPFEPFELIEKPIKKRLVVGKNLLPHVYKFDNPWGSSNIESTSEGMKFTLNTTAQSTAGITNLYNPFKSKKGQTYTLSFTARANRNGVNPNYIYFMRGNSDGTNKSLAGNTPALTTSWTRYSITGTYDNSADNAYILFGMASGINLNGDWIETKDVQLEEGSVSTSYEPQKFVNKNSKKFSKNILDMSIDNWERGGIAHANGLNTTSSFDSRVRTNNFGTISLNATYAYSIPSGYEISIFQYQSDGTYIKFDGWLSNKGVITTTGTTGKFKISFRKSDSSNFDSNILSNLPLIQIENGITSTPYEKYKIGNRPSQRKSASVLKYPFTFKRESVEYLDGIRYGINQPCIARDGIKIEESTINLAKGVNLGFNHGRWTPVSDYPSGLPVPVDRVWRRKNENTYWGTFNDFISSSPNPYNKVFTVSFWYYLEEGYDGMTSSTFYGTPTNGGYDYTNIATSLKNTFSNAKKGEWVYGEQTLKITTDAYSYNYFQGWGGGIIADGKHCYIANFQLEERPYATSYTTSKHRPSEILNIPTNAFDTKGFDIELTLTPLAITTVEHMYPFRIQGSSGNLFQFIIHKYGAIPYSEFYVNSVAYSMYIETTPPMQVGIKKKLRAKYDGDKQYFYVDDVLIGSGTVGVIFSDNNIASITLGSYNGIQPFNAMYERLVIKDRNGVVTFQI